MMRYSHLDAGAFRDRLILQINQTSSDGAGGFVENWQTITTVWARVLPARFEIRKRSEVLGPAYSYLIDVRQPLLVKTGMRFASESGGRIFEIKAVSDPDETARYWRCYCEDEGDAG